MGDGGFINSDRIGILLSKDFQLKAMKKNVLL